MGSGGCADDVHPAARVPAPAGAAGVGMLGPEPVGDMAGQAATRRLLRELHVAAAVAGYAVGAVAGAVAGAAA